MIKAGTFVTKRFNPLLLLFLATFTAHHALAADEPLPVEQVFLYTTTATEDAITVLWDIKSNHYLYKSRTKFLQSRSCAYSFDLFF